MGVKLHAAGCSIWGKAFLVGALLVLTGTAVPDRARAEGPLDFLFGGFQRSAPPPEAPPPPVGRLAPSAEGRERAAVQGRERVSGSGSVGRSGFCVRLCDGQHFRIRQTVNGTAEETCNAICPYSKTKLFFGSEIRSATARDGQRYTQLESAFLYRKKQAANCTCNGRDPFGLVPLGAANDPTLRPGDLVSTSEGLKTFDGKSAQGSESFTPVNPATLPKNLRPPPSQAALPAPTEPSSETMPPINLPRGR
ncbi:MAG: hypothetical protein C5B56_05545 [Proteobacteria bacterium]|nr:MAG: hypothetical protein C5B56_05545 [Pseudomonadota bacterium]